MPSLLLREEEIVHLLSIMRNLAHTLFLSMQTYMHPESFINLNWERSSTFSSPVLSIRLCQTLELILLNVLVNYSMYYKGSIIFYLVEVDASIFFSLSNHAIW